MSGQVLDSENWKLEAAAVINDVKDHVKEIRVSDKVQSTDQKIVLNLTILEDECYCIELSGLGFRVLGKGYDLDRCTNNDNAHYETPYGLLNIISPMFQQSFGNALINKLSSL